jgi:hypothetical protein
VHVPDGELRSREGDEDQPEQGDEQAELEHVRARRRGVFEVLATMEEVGDSQKHGLGRDPSDAVGHGELCVAPPRGGDGHDRPAQRGRQPEHDRPGHRLAQPGDDREWNASVGARALYKLCGCAMASRGVVGVR